MISIIIPAYNPQKTDLVHCIESLCPPSSRTPIEILLVDDGSEPEAGCFFDSLAKQYPPVRVFHTPNRGVSAARNYALDVASGDWILFVDADDWISHNALSKIETLCSDTDSDILFFGHVRNYPGKEFAVTPATYHHRQLIATETDKLELLKKTIAGSVYGEGGMRATCFRAVWAVLFRRDVLKGLRFPVNTPIGEDLVFRLWTQHAARQVEYIDFIFYHYSFAVTHASKRFRKDAVDEFLKELGLIEDFIQKNHLESELSEALSFRVVEIMTVLPKYCFFHKDNPLGRAERKKQASAFYASDLIRKHVTKDIISKLPIKRRIQTKLLLNHLYGLYMAITHLFTIGLN